MRNDDLNAVDASGAGTPVLDIEAYRDEVRGQFVSDEEADAYLRAMWFIMCAFVDSGIDLKSSTASLPFMRDFSSEQSAPEVKSSGTSKKETEETLLIAAQEDDS